MNGSRAIRRSLIAAVAGMLATLVAVKALGNVSYNGATELVLETAVTLIGGLVAFLLYGRCRGNGARGDLLLVYAVSVMAITPLVFAVLPAMFSGNGAYAAHGWARLFAALAANVLLLLAAVVPPGVERRLLPAREVIVVETALLGFFLAVLVFTSRAAAAAKPAAGSLVVLAVRALTLVCSCVAAVQFTRRAHRSGDDLLGWIGAATAVGAWAYAAYLLEPQVGSDALHAGDLLRFAMYLLLLVGAVLEISRFWQMRTAAAVESERRRLARDLHDGVVQELGYIRFEALRSADSEFATRITAAADRALNEARRSISALVQHPDEGLAAALARTSCEVADRYDVPVTLSLDEAVSVQPAVREALLRIAREAVANAARHARAPSIAVSLAAGCLQVEDVGCGFDPSVARPEGFGITSMRERAAAIDATVRIRSAIGRGTQVRVTW